MADARAGIRIVVHEYGAGQFLHQIGFFIGAAGRGDDAHGMAAMPGDRNVLFRYQRIKRTLLGDTPLNDTEGFSGSNRSRGPSGPVSARRLELSIAPN